MDASARSPWIGPVGPAVHILANTSSIRRSRSYNKKRKKLLRSLVYLWRQKSRVSKGYRYFVYREKALFRPQFQYYKYRAKMRYSQC